MNIFLRRSIVSLIVFGMFLAVHVTAQEPSNESRSITDPDNTARIQATIENIGTQIATLSTNLSETNIEEIGVSKDTIEKKVALLKDLKSIYERKLTTLQRFNSLDVLKSKLQTDRETFKNNGFSEPPPYSISMFDSLSDELEQAENQIATQQLASTNVQQELQQARLNLEKIEKKSREEKAAQKRTPLQQTPQSEWDLDLNNIETEIARQTVSLKELQYTTAASELEITKDRTDFLTLQLSVLRKRIRFTSSMLTEKVVDIEKRKDQIDQALDKAQNSLSTYQARLADAREQLERARGDDAIQRLRDIADTYATWTETFVEELEMLQEQKQLFTKELEVWRIRYNLFNKIETAHITQWNEQITQTLDNLNRTHILLQSRLLNNSSAITELQKRLSESELNLDTKSAYQSRLKALSRHEQNITTQIGAVTSIMRLCKTVQRHITETQRHVSVRHIAAVITLTLSKVWNFELLVIDDKAVTIKKVIISLLILTLGLFLTRRITQVIRYQAQTHIHLDESAAAALAKILYYFLIVVLVLFALHLVSIPLTLFTFLGGAIAIGIGFGAQNLLNNFLSGLIILMERPVKINDIIEVEGNYGIVRDIGARCTLIRLTSGIDVLVPNSSILEKNVVNWTHSDLNIRFSVKVGVAYGSPTRQVEKLIKQAVDENENILTFPAPIILFEDFGDNALSFEVFFWVQVHRLMDSRIVRSDLRFRIDELFREHKITIAFPQCDVHLDSLKPVDVRIVKSDS